MYEKLVNRLRKAAGPAIDFPDTLYDEAADAIEALKQTVEHYHGCSEDWYKEACDYKAMLPRWIPATERLPEKRRWVLCRCVADIIEVLRLENNEWYHDPMHVYYPSFVTHWMPLPSTEGLPQPPKEEVSDV